MIEDKKLEECYGMLGKKDVLSFMCLVHTENDSTGLSFHAPIADMESMLANAALMDPNFLIALIVAYHSVRKLAFSTN